jgi:hypothetical protein
MDALTEVEPDAPSVGAVLRVGKVVGCGLGACVSMPT